MYLWLLIAVSWWAVLGAPPPDEGECALLLAGPPRSSAYDYTINLLKGNFGYEGQQQCITYEAVNQAYLEARQRILVSQPKGEWKPEHYASVGELVLDISINLARRYGLTYEEIEKGLPLIDTSRTLIREVCPPVFSQVECRAGKYRRLDGLCNNLRHPTWGATNAPFQRLLSPLFADGMNAPRVARSGRDLPLSRVVSRTMHPDEGFHDHAGTVMVIAWGQFMDHDYTLTGTPLDPVSRNDPEECCKRPQHLKHPYCNEIRIPDDDYFYRLFGVKCIDFVRGFPSPRPGCRLGSRVPFNTLTGAIDGNTVYGVTEKFARKLRTGYGGLLRMNPVFQEYGLKDLLPLKLDIPDEGCTRPNKNMYCFEAGEIRVNEQLVLTVMHTLMAREHNRVARALAHVNPHWDDETLYQEARRVTIAEIQHITYNEFLPILLGKDVMEKFGLVLEKEGYWDGYDPHVNPDVLASFAAAAYRFGHSLLPTAVERWSKAHKFIASKRLSDLIRRPYDLYRAGVLDEYVMGLMNQVAQAMDDSITQEVTNHLFKKVGARFGMDLVSFNMQRGREFGLPGYMEFRKFCGLPGAETFDQLFGSMPNATVRKYSSIFERPDDVDLWSGGVSERALPGSMLGPTFACIIATQFSYSRRGDRFWFELPNQPSSFTPAQLAELRKSRLARVICDNTDIIDTVQLYPMVLPDHELNPRVPCRSGILPSMDFSKWAEPAPAPAAAFHAAGHAGHAEGFVTEAIVIEARSETNGSDTLVVTAAAAPTAGAATGAAPTAEVAAGATETTPPDTLLDQRKRQVPDGDALLKYVYKNDNSDRRGNKRSGPAANSVRRRRRALPETFLKAPLIVDYETSHAAPLPPSPPPLPRAFSAWPPALSAPELVKSSNLADFNIETLHGGVLVPDDVPPPPAAPSPPPPGDARSSGEADASTSDEDSIETTDRDKYNANDDHTQTPGHKNEKESLEDVRENPSSRVRGHERDETSASDESDESGERTVSERHEDLTKENDTETSAEVADYPPTNEPYNVPEDGKLHYKENPSKIQDVDLGDFSYEKIQINKDGNVVPVTDSQDGIDASIEHVSTVKPATENNKKYDELNARSDETTSIDSSSVEANGDREPTHIDDGEVKPVIEINAETEDDSNEDHSEESIGDGHGSSERDPDSENDESPRSNTPVPQPPRNDGHGDVKQQFERIPLNYSHIPDRDAPLHTDDADDTPPARYDQNLNLKFDDISIKLPEIKLPEDILAYSYENPPTADSTDRDRDRDREKKRFYHYSEERRDDDDEDDDTATRKSPSDGERERDDSYRGYYGRLGAPGRPHRHEDTDEDEDADDEEEDLYEKFVKERFGPRPARRPRARPRRGDPGLRSRLQRLLQRTRDPALARDSNYMWALEYTDKL